MQRIGLFSFAFFMGFGALAHSVAAEPPVTAAENPALSPADAAEPAPLIGPPVPGGLTAAEAAERAEATSHEVRAQDEAHTAALASVDQANAAFLPRLTNTLSYTRLSKVSQPSLGNLVVAPQGTPAGPLAGDAQLAAVPLRVPTVLNQYSAQTTLEIQLSDYVLRLPQLKAAAEHNARSAELLAQASRLRVAADARVTYYNWARARLQAEVARRALVSAQAHLKDVEVAHEQGAASKADVLRVQSQVANAELTLTRAVAAGDIYDRRLHIALHDPRAEPYQLGEDLRDTTPSAARTPNENALVASAKANRLEPRALDEGSTAEREQAKSLWAAELPRLSAVGNMTYANPNQRVFPQSDKFTSTWEAGVRLTWSASEILGTEAQKRGKRAESRKIDAERAELEDNIALEVKQQLLAKEESAAALVTAERGLRAAEESYRVRRLLFQNGRATSVELTDAETEWSRAQLEVIGARIDCRIAEVQLAHALGEDVKGGSRAAND